MTGYLVRAIEDKQIHGLFCVNTLEELFWLIDECCTPTLMEFSPVNQCGIYFHGPDAPRPEDDEDENVENSAAMTSALRDFWLEKESNAWATFSKPPYMDMSE